jgi:hypothetical protein
MSPQADVAEGTPPGAGWSDALARVLAFARRHGPSHAALAMHAAVPLGLTPELLHLVRINFLRRTTPWIAEADLLLSPLCQDVGEGFYQMDPAVRDLLVDELRRDPNFGEGALRGVAELLLAYVARTLPVARAGEERPFLLAQEWTALAYLRPAEAAEALAAALRQGLTEGRPADAVRVASVAEALAAPLRGEEKVLLYAAGVEKLAAGDVATATRIFDAVGPGEHAPVVGGVTLPAPAQLLAAPPPRREERGERPAADAEQVIVYHPRRVRTGREYPVFVFLGPQAALATAAAHPGPMFPRGLKVGNLRVLREGTLLVTEALDEDDFVVRQSLEGYVASATSVAAPARRAGKDRGDVRGEEENVTIEPILAPMVFQPLRATLPSAGEVRQAEFQMRVPEPQAGTTAGPYLARGIVQVLRRPVSEVEVPFRVSVTDSPLPTVYISYRRGDPTHAGSLVYASLIQRFDPRNVVWDVATMAAGENPVGPLAERIALCDVMLVVIGPQWLGPPGEGGRRLDHAGDWIRLEVEAALREGLPLIPVLVDDARFPDPEDLPESLRRVAEFNSVQLWTGPYWSEGMDRLLKFLEPSDAPPETKPEGVVNPFVVGMPVGPESAVFIDRPEVVRQIQQAVLGPDPRRLILLSAPRRMGRTSLLRSLPHLLDRHIAVVYLDCQGLAVSMEASPSAPPRTLLWGLVAERISRELIDRGLEVKGPSFGRKGPMPETALLQWLWEVEPRLPKDLRILVCLDEAEKLDDLHQRGLADFQYELAVLLNNCPQLTLLLTQTLEREYPRRFKHFEPILLIRLGPLSREATRTLLTHLASGLGITFGAQVLEIVYEATGGHPFLVQALGKTLIDRLNEQGKLEASTRDVAPAVEQVLDGLGETFFQYLWEQAGAGGQAVLRAVAGSGRGVGDARVRADLEALGLLTPRGDLTGSLFLQWIQRTEKG